MRIKKQKYRLFSNTLCSIVFILFVCQNTFSQKYNLLNYTTKDGLPSQIVNDVIQDNDGYFWFATQSGVSKFNGHDFLDFIPIKELSGVDAVSIVQDAKGRICIGTNTAGLFVYDYTKTVVFNDKKGLQSNVIRKLFLDKQKNLWVLTSAGVYQFVNDSLQPFVDSKNVFQNGVLSMTEGKDGTFYFGTQGNGLVSYSKGTFNYFGEENGISDPYIFSISTRGDSVLVGTTNQGVLVGLNGHFSPLNIPEISDAWISNILQVKNGMHIISSSGLVQYFSNGKYNLILESNGLTTNDLYNGYFDRENNLWLTSGNGISCLRKEQIISLDAETGLTSNNVTCLTRLSNGLIAAGTYGTGINLMAEDGTIVQKIIAPELQNTKITCLTEIKSQKELWIGTEQSNGIIILDLNRNSFKIKRILSKLNKTYLQTVTKIEEDKKGAIWISTFNAGLFRISGDNISLYDKTNGLPSNEIYSFMLDKNDVPWISVYQKGLYRKKGESFEHIYDAKHLNDKVILCLQQDENNTIYIGTKNNGLSIYKNEKWTTVSKQDGLLSNAIQAVAIKNNQIWVGTNRGINLLIPSGKEYKIITYDERSGLKNTEIQQNAILYSNDFVWIGSSTGISKIKTDYSNQIAVKPFIKIQNAKLFFNDVDWKSKTDVSVDKEGVPTSISLSHKENHLSFNFCALTTSSVFYTYLLEGQDNKWSPLTDKRDVTFSNLNPGNYVFKVKSIDNYGNESDELSIPIVIHPPFYQTWWFRILTVLVIGISITFFVRLRERNYLERQQVLENTVQERTGELMRKNKEILDSITYAKRIQTAMLPSEEVLTKAFHNLFVFYRPKDIVAGDFYWYDAIGDKLLLAVADCTGHGVPGAMVSVVCNNALNRAVREFGITEPAKILDKSRELILMELSKNNEEVNDGMDISIATFDMNTKEMQWAGANNPLWVLPKDANQFTEYKGDKQPVGRHITNAPFTNHTIQLNDGDLLYFFSDGLADQFGGEKGKKLKTTGLKEILLIISHLPMDDQLSLLETMFNGWKGDLEQIDDVCLVGIKI